MPRHIPVSAVGRELADRLGKIRANGATQRTVAELSGVPMTAVARLEQGRVRPDEVDRLAAALDALDELADYEHRPERPVTGKERRRYVERLEEESAELRFRLRAAGLRQTDRDWAADRYFPQRGLVNLLWFLLDGGEPSRSELDVLFQAIELAEKHAPAAPLDRPSAVRDVSAPGGGGT